MTTFYSAADRRKLIGLEVQSVQTQVRGAEHDLGRKLTVAELKQLMLERWRAQSTPLIKSWSNLQVRVDGERWTATYDVEPFVAPPRRRHRSRRTPHRRLYKGVRHG